MRTKKETERFQKYIKIFALLFCTIIGGYGIINAPASDQKKLEQELTHNEKVLRKTESTPQAKPSASNIPSTKPENTGSQKQIAQTEKTISVIGDSVFLGAAPSFQKLYKNAEIDAKISRQVRQGLAVAKKMAKRKKLGNTIIISLGTNGCFNQATGQELIDYLGPDRTIYWINAYGKNLDIQQDVNKTIQKLVKKNNHVYLIPWAKEAKKHPNWFYQDGTHLNIKGQAGFSRFIQKEIENSR